MLIGLMGYGGCGKSTAARYLESRHDFVAPHIGKPLKEMIGTFLIHVGYKPYEVSSYIDGSNKRTVLPELGCTATQLQQWLGTEWGRNCVGPDTWLNIWKSRVTQHLQSGKNVLSESVRFANEADWIRAQGGFIVLIERRGVGPLEGGHTSEILPATPDYVVYNDADTEYLYAALNRMMDDFNGR